jgi:hypothetical protein
MLHTLHPPQSRWTANCSILPCYSIHPFTSDECQTVPFPHTIPFLPSLQMNSKLFHSPILFHAFSHFRWTANCSTPSYYSIPPLTSDERQTVSFPHTIPFLSLLQMNGKMFHSPILFHSFSHFRWTANCSIPPYYSIPSLTSDERITVPLPRIIPFLPIL